MTVGQSTLSIAELPFVYTIVNLAVISSTGVVTIDNLYAASLGAGLFGTFFVVLKPSQRIIDWQIRKKFESLLTYKFSDKEEFKANIDITYLELNLFTTPIKYEKDKISGTAYFIVVLFFTDSILLTESFQKAISLDAIWAIVLSIVFFGMLIVVAIIMKGYVKTFSRNLQLSALYMDLVTKRGREVPTDTAELERLNIAGSALDLNNWPLVKKMIEKVLQKGPF